MKRRKTERLYKKELPKLRREGALVLLNGPTNIPRARRLGYLRKQGYYIVRVRVRKGRSKRPTHHGGRKPAHGYHYKSRDISKQVIAEQRAAREFRNWEVLNSYWIAEDGQYKWYEVIMIDPSNPAVKHSAKNRRGRAFRLLTAAGRRSRGLM